MINLKKLFTFKRWLIFKCNKCNSRYIIETTYKRNDIVKNNIKFACPKCGDHEDVSLDKTKVNISFYNSYILEGLLRLVLFLLKGITFLSLIAFALVNIYRFTVKYVPVNYNSDKNYKTMSELLSDNYDKYKGKLHKLKNFSLEKNTLTFSNFSSNNSLGGNCNGYSMFLKYIYTGSIPKSPKYSGKYLYDLSFLKNNPDLSNYKLDNNTINKLYGPLSEYKPYNLKNEIPKYSKDMTSKELFDVITKDSVDDFSDKGIKQYQLIQILNAIDYFQLKNLIPPYNVEYILPHEYSNGTNWFQTLLIKYSFLGNKKNAISNSKENLNIKDITDKIDNNIPVVINISNEKYGHAIFAYAYEKINDNLYKVHVFDSNLPLLDGNDLKTEKVNCDIKNNDYIVFQRYNKNDIWQYKYDPIINNNYIYRGQFNSFIPDTILALK